MIAQVILYGWCGVIDEWASHPYQCDPALVVHHMQRVVFLYSSNSNNPLILKDAVNIDGDLNLPTLFANQLLHSLPTRVIEIMSMNRGFAGVGLGAVDSHTIRIIPLEMARSGFPAHIA